jgi:hypothetical protein
MPLICAAAAEQKPRIAAAVHAPRNAPSQCRREWLRELFIDARSLRSINRSKKRTASPADFTEQVRQASFKVRSLYYTPLITIINRKLVEGAQLDAEFQYIPNQASKSHNQRFLKGVPMGEGIPSTAKVIVLKRLIGHRNSAYVSGFQAGLTARTKAWAGAMRRCKSAAGHCEKTKRIHARWSCNFQTSPRPAALAAAYTPA